MYKCLSPLLGFYISCIMSVCVCACIYIIYICTLKSGCNIGEIAAAYSYFPSAFTYVNINIYMKKALLNMEKDFGHWI